MQFTAKKITPANLRTWYCDLYQHCFACGIFTIPYELFVNRHGGSTGFEYGKDLPASFEANHNQCSGLIQSFLRKTDSFPESASE
jgi:hypothetical protein